MKIQDKLVLDVRERYDRLNSYRSVAQELDNVVSFTMIRHIVVDGAWSPTVARRIWPAKKRNRVWMRTDDLDKAVETLLKHYPERSIIVEYYQEAE